MYARQAVAKVCPCCLLCYSCTSLTTPISFLCWLYHYSSFLYSYFITDKSHILGSKSHIFLQVYLIVISQPFWKRHVMTKYLEISAEITVILLRHDQISASFDPCTKGGKGNLLKGIRELSFLFLSSSFPSNTSSFLSHVTSAACDPITV